MAITLIVGSPGSGKSYEAVAHHIMPALRAGRKVITNLPLNLDRIRGAMPGLDPYLVDVRVPVASVPIRFSSMVDYGDPWRSDDGGVGPLYVIDEAHQCLPKSKTDPAVLNWFALHRHEAADVVVLTQQAKQLHTGVTGLIQWQHIVRKNTMIGSAKTYRQIAKDGMTGDAMPAQVMRYDKAIFPLYQSYTLGGGSESVVVGTPLWKRWPFIGLGLIGAVLVYMLVWGGGSLNPTTVISPKTDPVERPNGPSGVPVRTDKASTENHSGRDATGSNPAPQGGLATETVGNDTLASSTLDGFLAGQTAAAAPVPSVPGLRPSDVLDIQWTRLGDRCAARLRMRTLVYTELWQWASEGWHPVLRPVDGDERDIYGTCHLRISRGSYAHEWGRDQSFVYLPAPEEVMPPTAPVPAQLFAQGLPRGSPVPYGDDGLSLPQDSPVLTPDSPLPPATQGALFPGAGGLAPPPDSDAVTIDGVKVIGR